jgi:hypothetical protein
MSGKELLPMSANERPHVFIYETPIGHHGRPSDQVENAELAAKHVFWHSSFFNAIAQAVDSFDPSFSALVVPLTTEDAENRNAQPLLDKAAYLAIPKALITFPRATIDDLLEPRDIFINRLYNGRVVPKLTLWLSQLVNKSN